MDIAVLTALLSSCLPFLLKLGDKAAESAVTKLGADAWETGKKIWETLRPKAEEKKDVLGAAEALAASPDDEVCQQFFQNRLQKLLKDNPDLAAEIAQILAEQPLPAIAGQVSQQIGKVEGQAINQMTGGQAIGQINAEKMIGQISGNVEGGVNL